MMTTIGARFEQLRAQDTDLGTTCPQESLPKGGDARAQSGRKGEEESEEGALAEGCGNGWIWSEDHARP